MHVVQLTYSRLSGYGGIQTSVKLLSKGLAHLGVRVSEVMLPSLDPNHVLRPGDTGRRLAPYKLEETLSEVLTEAPNTVIHSHNLHMQSGPGVSEAVLRCIERLGLAHVSMIHDVGARSSIGEKLLQSSYCVTTSGFNQHRLEAEYKHDKIHLVPLPLDFNAMKETGQPFGRRVCFPGRLVYGKGAHRAVMLMGAVADALGDVTLVLSQKGSNSYGEHADYSGELARLAACFPRLRLEFHSGDGDGLPKFYSASQLTLITPICVEGFNYTALESLACGRPVVASPTGGMEWLKSTDGCICVPEMDILLLAAGLNTVFENWVFWHRKALHAREQLKKRHDVGTVAVQYREIYSALLK